MTRKDKRKSHQPFAHTFYFELADSSQELVDRFVDACNEYLRHSGQTYFSVGIRDREENRSVSALYFEVAVNMVFRDKAAYEEYRSDPRHLEFITEVAGMSPNRRVYDSYLVSEINLNSQKKAPAKRKPKRSREGR